MSWTILVPVHKVLAPEAAIEFAETGFPDAELELVECKASAERAADVAVIADERGGDSREVPSNASDALLNLAHEMARVYGVDLRTATATGSFGQATVAYAEASGADMIILGVDRGKSESDSQIRDNINYIQSAANVPYSIVRT